MLRYFVAMTSVVLPLASHAQGMSEAQRVANDAFIAQDWPKAAEAYQALIRENPRVAQPHFRLGVALMGLRRHNEALPHLVTAESLGTPAAQVAFRMAQIHAAGGALDSAFQQLRRATAAGLSTSPPSTDTNPDLARLRRDTRYAQFLTDVDRNARPCMYDPKFKEFDFWLGTWDVRPNGSPTAPPSRNVITKILNGCVLLESYSTSLGFTGQSYNIYDRTRNKWFQKWVDVSGGLHEYAGELRDGNMAMEGDTPVGPPSTGRVRTRLTFFPRPDGSVRQFSERTVDDGKTWQVNYDLIYTKATAP
jgi:hypothetical protein